MSSPWSMKVFGINMGIQDGSPTWMTQLTYQKFISVPNGLLMSSDLHSMFDQYLFSINPDVCTLGKPLFVLGTLTQ